MKYLIIVMELGKVAIIRYPGSNCDIETKDYFKDVFGRDWEPCVRENPILAIGRYPFLISLH